jgi:hypothetical protein
MERGSAFAASAAASAAAAERSEADEERGQLLAEQQQATSVAVEGAGATPAPAQAEPAPAAAPGEARDAAAAPGAGFRYLSFWVAMSISVILFNKDLYSGPFPYPLTLTALHMAFAAVVTAGMRATGRLEVPDFPWPLYARAVLPIGMLFATALACSNLAVMRLTVPFVQMCKSIAPVAALAISVTLGVETFTPQLGLIASTMSLSILVNTVGELNFNLIGFVFQIASILAETTRLIVMQKLLQQHLPDKPSPLVPLSLFTPGSFLLLLPVALIFEPGAFPALVANTTTPSLVLLNTCVAFSLNVAVIMLVGSSSGLTLVLAGIVKDVLLVVTSVLLFGSPISYMQVGGYLVGLFGFNSESSATLAPHTHCVNCRALSLRIQLKSDLHLHFFYPPPPPPPTAQ